MTTPRPIPFAGRRKGRPLNTGRQAAVETLLPQLTIPLTPDVDPAALLPGKAAWHLEIGPGQGEHLLAQALAQPDIGFLTAEPFLNGSAALLAGIARENISNIRILPDDVRPLLEVLKPARLAMIYLLFSDPWPKARHAKRRVLQQETIAAFACVLQPGGRLRIATDDPTLQAWVAEQMEAQTLFAPAPGLFKTRPDWPPTRYEQKALTAGRVPQYWEYMLSK